MYQLQKLGLPDLSLLHKIRHKLPKIICEHFKNVRNVNSFQVDMIAQ